MSEVLLIFIVALLVLGPKQLPMVASHLGRLVKQLNRLKSIASAFWQEQLNQQTFQDNTKKAQKADEDYLQQKLLQSNDSQSDQKQK